MVITIANESFSTQKSLQDRCTSIKETVSLETPLTGDDFDLISKVILFHPDLVPIAPISNAAIYLGKLAYGKTGFYIQYPEAAPQVVGLKKAIKAAFGKTSVVASKLYDFKIAARSAIADQIIAKRRSFIGNNREHISSTFVSDLSGNTFPMIELVIDHQPPHYFDSLLIEFLKSNNINPIHIELTRSNGWTLFAEQALSTQWNIFHLNNAVLRAISANENAKDKPMSNDWASLSL